ncbi:hypothetical protein MED297_00445 [Reinekea sp. MED297]|uniref:Uncharacterized protein n=1 Tax=Reinekea blandensis MED297 TaxID=314283 RepID=A4BIA4_9GAMM|nr:hypothetical protein MED297_00445 [Reinekea sp. MED297] [Reinekea blandensis MED297]
MKFKLKLAVLVEVNTVAHELIVFFATEMFNAKKR